MKFITFCIVSVLCWGCATTTHSGHGKDHDMTLPANPPETRRNDPGLTLHGVKVPDPYQWLEEEKAPEVQDWMDAQDAYTRDLLSRMPLKASLEARLKELLYIETMSAPSEKEGRLFFTRRAANQEKSVYFMRMADGEDKVVLDPHMLSEDLSTSVGIFVPSPNGQKVAYSLKEDNADESVMYVLDLATGTSSDKITGAKYAWPSWTPDSKGFYYTHLPKGPEISVDERPGFAHVRFHQLGSDSENDPVVHPHTGSPETFIGPSLSKDGRWLFVMIHHGWNRDDVYRMDLNNKEDGFKAFAVDLPAHFEVTTHGDYHYILTDKDAPTKKLMRTHVDKPSMEHWTEVIPADASVVLEDIRIVDNRILSLHLVKASSRLKLREMDGTGIQEVTLPGIGTVRDLRASRDSKRAFFQFSSFTTPPTIMELTIASGDTTVWKEIRPPADMSPYEVEQVFFPSRDGTLVSMFIVRAKDMVKDGKTPLLLYGYGGFNVSLLPSFVTTYIPWLEQGGAFAIPNLRGGGEYGEAWHKDGMKHKKQNVFDDYIAAAEYLIANKYTSPEKLAIRGGSNGGLLVGAVMTQRPELYGAVSCAVPLLDMVRYHLFGSGRTWIPEYGSAEDEEEFKTLFAYSPYHHVKEGVSYPPTLILTSDHDDRVDPLHARKMAALLQHSSTNPTLLRIERNAGHGGADKVSERVSSTADALAFLLDALGVKGATPDP